MKKLLAILGAATLLFATACDNSAGTDPVPAPTVNVGTLSDLPATRAEYSPASEAEAYAMVEDVIYGIMSLAEGEEEPETSISGARATTSETIPVNFVSEDGKITLSGSMTHSMTMPDENSNYTANVWYNDVIAMRANANIAGTLNEATVLDKRGTYTVTGKFGLIQDTDVNADMRMNYAQGDEKPTPEINMDMAIALQYGIAFSILRDNDVGARFMLTYTGAAGFKDVDMEGILNIDMEAAMEELASKTATLTTYDDEGEVLFTQSIPLSELPGLSELFESEYDEGGEGEDLPEPMSVR